MTKQLGVSRVWDCQDLHNVIDIIVIVKAQRNIILHENMLRVAIFHPISSAKSCESNAFALLMCFIRQ